jgi:uncharacterized membrane protein (DUF485 family)
MAEGNNKKMHTEKKRLPGTKPTDKRRPMKFEHKQQLSKFVMILGFVLIAFGSIIIFNEMMPKAYGQNVTLINQTAINLNPLMAQTSINVTYPIIFLIGFIFSALATFRLKNEQWGIIFSILCVVFSVILGFVFVSPFEFTFDTTQQEIRITEINNTITSTYTKSFDNAVIFPKNSEFRFIFSSLFMVLSIFFGLVTIIIMTKLNKK